MAPPLQECALSAITSENKNGGDMDWILYRTPMERLAFDIKDILGEAYIQSSNANAYRMA